MDSCKMIVSLASVCVLVLGSATAQADTADDMAAAVKRLEEQNQTLRGEVESMRRQLGRIEAERGESWLNERRAEEVKTLIAEVLSDADMRASLLDEGVTAGHNGKNFFLESADGNFLMNIAGQMQFRFIANWADDPFVDEIDDSGDEPEAGQDGVDDQTLDESESGFSMNRLKLMFSGHVTANPKIEYQILMAANRSGGAWTLENAVMGHTFDSGVKVRGGQFILPFLREELVSSKRQLAMTRGSACEYFTLDWGQGVEVSYGTDSLHVAAAVSDGADSSNVDWADDATDIALTARADLRLAGDWKQAQDFSAWSGEEFAAFVGGAMHWETAETGTSAANNQIFTWTVDGMMESCGVGVMGAVMGLHTDNEGTANFADYGAQVEAGVFLIPDKLQPFVRYDYIDVDGMDQMNLLTVGCNYYLNRHNAKFTADVVYAFDPLFDTSRNFNDPATSGLGLRDDVDGQDGQTALRAQFQLLF